MCFQAIVINVLIEEISLLGTSSMAHPNIFLKNYRGKPWIADIPVIPVYSQGFILIPAWISNHIHQDVWDEITYPLTNFHCATVEVWEWISFFISYFNGPVIT